ncbi:hypothetical protein ABT160_09330 [Streptomyces sp. NPDC001941]
MDDPYLTALVLAGQHRARTAPLLDGPLDEAPGQRPAVEPAPEGGRHQG